MRKLLAACALIVALAFIALSVTFWTVARRDSGPTTAREIVGAGIMGFAVAGMHYTAMTSTLCFARDGARVGVLARTQAEIERIVRSGVDVFLKAYGTEKLFAEERASETA